MLIRAIRFCALPEFPSSFVQLNPDRDPTLPLLLIMNFLKMHHGIPVALESGCDWLVAGIGWFQYDSHKIGELIQHNRRTFF